MKTSPTITKITPAFLTAQKKIEAVKKEAENPFFKSRYADLPSVITACKKQLNDNGIAVLQPVIGDFVETRLVHESGEWFSSKTRIVCAKPNDPQAYGSAVTYARRYGLQSMVFMSAEDDDGEEAMNREATSSTLKENIYESLAKPTNHPDNEFSQSKCQKCGAPIAISSKGHPYCTAKCWLKEAK